MGLSNNGVSPTSNATTARLVSSSPRCPRRVVLLRGGEGGEVEQVLREYQATDVSGNRLHAAVHRLADEHRGRFIAAEWLGPLGWTRFLWCRLD